MSSMPLSRLSPQPNGFANTLLIGSTGPQGSSYVDWNIWVPRLSLMSARRTSSLTTGMWISLKDLHGAETDDCPASASRVALCNGPTSYAAFSTRSILIPKAYNRSRTTKFSPRSGHLSQPLLRPLPQKVHFSSKRLQSESCLLSNPCLYPKVGQLHSLKRSASPRRLIGKTSN